MKFGVRECANIVFRAKTATKIGKSTFQAGQPVLYIDSATTSSLEQATTTVYAQGGRGNTRLISWEGEKTVTFSFTDALLSPIGFSILSGAGLFQEGNGADDTGSGKPEAPAESGQTGKDLVHFHMTSMATLTHAGAIDLSVALASYGSQASICSTDAPIYIMGVEEDGSLTGELYKGTVTVSGSTITLSSSALPAENSSVPVMVDYYIDLPGAHVYEADITAETFGGNYYVEADTLFRDVKTGKDLPANLTFPNVKIQSNFTMTFAGTGDPSTFDFTMDAFPDYTYFDKKKKVICVLQIVDMIGLLANENIVTSAELPVMYHDTIPMASGDGGNGSKTS